MPMSQMLPSAGMSNDLNGTRNTLHFTWTPCTFEPFPSAITIPLRCLVYVTCLIAAIRRLKLCPKYTRHRLSLPDARNWCLKVLSFFIQFQYWVTYMLVARF